MRESLDEIALRHGTDKASKHPVKGHGYTKYYEWAFHGRRLEELKILEIGVGGGESIKTWLDYFENSRVFGVDVVQDTNPWNTVNPVSPPHERYRFVQGPQESPVFWQCFLADQGKDWDIIIDDGSHKSLDIITSFASLFPVVRPGGLYCIEDLGVDMPGSVFHSPNAPTHHGWLAKLMMRIDRGGGELEAIHYMQELAILRKRE